MENLLQDPNSDQIHFPETKQPTVQNINEKNNKNNFSKLKLIKTYLRNPMGQVMLSILAIMSINHNFW